MFTYKERQPSNDQHWHTILSISLISTFSSFFKSEGRSESQEADLTAVTTNTSLRRVFFSLLKPKARGRPYSVTTNTSPRRVFFSLLKPSMVFSRALTEKVPSSLNEGQRLTRIILNDDGVCNYFIKMKD